MSHLPPGHRAGRQTWRRRIIRTAAALVMLVPGVGLLGWAAVIAFTADEGRGAAIPLAIFGLFLCGMWLLFRGPGGARRAGGVRLVAEPRELRRGETVEARIALKTGAGPHTVALERMERWDEPRVTLVGADVPFRATVRVIREDAFPVHTEVAADEAERSFRFRVPDDAPHSYEGSALTVAWRVTARPERRRRRDVPIWVSP